MFPNDTLILLVDDMASAREHLKTQLIGLGYSNLMEAENGAAGLDMVSSSLDTGVPVGLVFSDWNMPEMTGLEFLQKTRALPQVGSVPFIMITSQGDSASVLKAIQSGVTDYIMKPFDPEMLKTKIAAAWKRTQGKK